MELLKARSPGSSLLVLRLALALALAVALASGGYGCVFEDKCVGAGVSRDADGKCRATGPAADAGPTDAGARDSSSPDAGTPGDAGDVDAGAIDPDSGTPDTIFEIAAGAAHLCARTSLGALYCRGSNALGQLATGDVALRTGPVRIDFGDPVAMLAGAHTTVCALTDRPAAACWGGNTNGQVGNGSFSDQVTSHSELAGIGNLAAMASSFANTCVTHIGAGGTYCWGRNDNGQLGFPTGGADTATPSMPVLTDRGSGPTPLEFVNEIAIGDRHICFRVNDGRAFCVGENPRGQLGRVGPASSLALEVAGLTNVRSIAAAGMHVCAVEGDSVYCWGENEKGQVDPTAPSMGIATPTLVAGVTGAVQVTTGMESSCALLTSGQVMCWGSRERGAIGDGGPVDTGIAPPTTVALVTDIRQISSSFVWLNCAVSNSGVVSCWGTDGVTLLGSGATSTVFPDGVVTHGTPAEVPMLP